MAVRDLADRDRFQHVEHITENRSMRDSAPVTLITSTSKAPTPWPPSHAEIDRWVHPELGLGL